VAAAPEAAGVRVWQVMSRDGSQARGNPPEKGARVGYPHEATIDDAELSRPVWDKPICSGTLKTHPIKSLEDG